MSEEQATVTTSQGEGVTYPQYFSVNTTSKFYKLLNERAYTTVTNRTNKKAFEIVTDATLDFDTGFYSGIEAELYAENEAFVLQEINGITKGVDEGGGDWT